MNDLESISEKINRISQSRGIKKILFVCLGNLCRSPMAEYMLRDRLESKGNTDIKISSGGFLDQTGARVPKEIHNLMHEAGIDISAHRSSPVNIERIRESDLIIVMEMRQRDVLARQCPEDVSRIFLLSQFDKQNHEERDISDPMGETTSYYQTCFNEIRIFVEGLTELILSISSK